MKKYLLPLMFLALACVSQSFPPERRLPKKVSAFIHHTPFLMPPDSTNTYRFLVDGPALPENPTNAFLTIIQGDAPPIVVPVRIVPTLTNVWHLHVYPGEEPVLTPMPQLNATNTLYLATNRANLMLLEVRL